MIGRLQGRIDHKAPDHVLIDVGGVGYIVFCSDRTLAALPPEGEAAALYTDLVVREDLLQLFGFPTLYEREWHRLLVTVQGIGAKGSLAILGTLGVDGVARAITLGDWASVKAAPGVGPKIAQRLVNELKDKAPAVMAMGGQGAAAATVPRAGPGPVPPTTSGAQAEAMSALQNLGYPPAEAAAATARAQVDAPDADTAALIRAALKILGPGADA